MYHKMSKLLSNGIMTRQQIANFTTQGLKVFHNSEEKMFYAEIDDKTAALYYKKRNGVIEYHHTEVPTIFRGKGIAQLLAEEAFKYASENKLTMDLTCDYLQNYYRKNKEKYKDIKCLDLIE